MARESQQNSLQLWTTCSGVLLLSGSVLVYEIALTRIASLILTYHYAFLVVSLSLLGLGLGGTWAYRREMNRPLSVPKWTAGASIWMAALPFLVSWMETPGLMSLLVAAFPPFLFAGAVLASVFRRFAAYSGLVYGADLAGAAAGALAVVPLLSAGAPAAVLSAAAGGAAASLLFLRDLQMKRAGFWGVTAAVITGGLLWVQTSTGAGARIPIGRDPGKDMYRIVNHPSVNGTVVDSRWSAFGRSDLVRRSDEPDMMDLFVDGAAGTAMYRWPEPGNDSSRVVHHLDHHFTGSFVLRQLRDSQKDHLLTIGPGGGRDVLAAIRAGVRKITAVEVNPEFVAIVRDYGAFNGGIYDRSDVQVVVGEGRSFLKRSRDRYDVILLTLPITKSSRSAEGYALTENYLFTRESFQDYLDHLTTEGALVIVNHALDESVKLLTTALAAFQDLGIPTPEAMHRVAILGDRMNPVVVVKRSPFTATEADVWHIRLHEAGFLGRQSYIPRVEQVVRRVELSDDLVGEWRMMNQAFIDLAQGNLSLDALVRGVPIDIAPPTDDRPFFFKLEPGVPGVLAGLGWAAALVLAAVVGVPLLTWKQGPFPGRSLLLFSGIGAGFMLTEVALFQKLVLYLGHPTMALSLLLFSLLVGTGVGSLFSQRVRDTHLSTGLTVCLLAAAGGVIAVPPLLENWLAAHAVDGAIGVPAALTGLGLLGLVLGFPFPLGVRLMASEGKSRSIPWMWAVNGIASVFGSVLAVVIAVSAGLSWALLTGAACYGVVAISSVGRPRGRASTIA